MLMAAVLPGTTALMQQLGPALDSLRPPENQTHPAFPVWLMMVPPTVIEVWILVVALRSDRSRPFSVPGHRFPVPRGIWILCMCVGIGTFVVFFVAWLLGLPL